MRLINIVILLLISCNGYSNRAEFISSLKEQNYEKLQSLWQISKNKQDIFSGDWITFSLEMGKFESASYLCEMDPVLLDNVNTLLFIDTLSSIKVLDFNSDSLKNIIKKVDSKKMIINNSNSVYLLTHFAVLKGNLGLLKLLLKNGYKINGADFEGRNILMLSIWKGYDEITNYLYKEKVFKREDVSETVLKWLGDTQSIYYTFQKSEMQFSK